MKSWAKGPRFGRNLQEIDPWSMHTYGRLIFFKIPETITIILKFLQSVPTLCKWIRQINFFKEIK